MFENLQGKFGGWGEPKAFVSIVFFNSLLNLAIHDMEKLTVKNYNYQVLFSYL